MNKSWLCFLAFVAFGCSQPDKRIEILQARVDSLERRIAAGYKPGFGEFMSSIQVHHNKLWFAGIHQNWKLADFEIHEMMEAVENIRLYETDRKESRMIGLLDAPVDSVITAIESKDPLRFKSSYNLLTNTCNKCHREVQFEFNVVKTPDSPPFSNQDFSSH